VPGLSIWIDDALADYELLVLTPAIWVEAGLDLWDNPDPADRLIIATARTYQLELVHTDRAVRQRADLRQTYYRDSRSCD